jgi:hypothetical protein
VGADVALEDSPKLVGAKEVVGLKVAVGKLVLSPTGTVGSGEGWWVGWLVG